MDRQKIRCSILLLIWGLVTSSLSDQFDLLPVVDQQQTPSDKAQREGYWKSSFDDEAQIWLLSLSLAPIEECPVLSNTTNTLTSKH